MRAFIVLLATACAAYVCLLSSRRYFHSWVQTVIERTDVHVSEIPFPAVTICPVKGLNLLRLEQEATTFLGTTKQQHQQSLATDKELHDLHMLLNTMNELMWPDIENTADTVTTLNAKEEVLHHSNQSLPVVEHFLESFALGNDSSETMDVEDAVKTKIDLDDLLAFLSFECEDIFAECTWRRVKMPCCQLFHKIHTYKGICYSFNSILVEVSMILW